MSKPLVSVWMITYNHEKYIRQALESVFTQQTDFEYEVVIGEDCSTDSTRSIIKEFEAKYPDILIPVYHDVNVGMVRNAFEFCYPKLRGKYVAFLEGDDYWVDNLKLQKQFDFLERNKGFVGSGHLYMTYDEASGELCRPKNNFIDKSEIVLDDILNMANPIPFQSSTIFFLRRVIDNRALKLIYKCPIGDLPLFFILLNRGKLKNFNTSHMSVYRVLRSGASKSFNTRIVENSILRYKTCLLIDEYLKPKRILSNILSMQTNSLLIKSFKARNFKIYIYTMGQILFSSRIRVCHKVRTIVNLCLYCLRGVKNIIKINN